MQSGVVLIDKPSGITSFRVVSTIKRLFGTKKVGHAGTLDPMATGLLPILLNKATKIQDFLQNADKEYLAEFKLGIITDTEDITGKVVKTFSDFNISKEYLSEVLANFKGEILQTPPMYSAISKDGVRLYKLARKGLEIEREKRKVIINKLDLLDFSKAKSLVRILVNCSKGTYIRTLCADIGNTLGCGATLTSLRRTKTHSFCVEDSIKLCDIESLDYISLKKVVIPLDKVLENYNSIYLDEERSKRFITGCSFKINLALSTSFLRVYRRDKLFLGIGKYDSLTKKISTYKLLLSEK